MNERINETQILAAMIASWDDIKPDSAAARRAIRAQLERVTKEINDWLRE
jgi:hypothetical protein